MASIYVIQHKETNRKYVGLTRKKDPHIRWKEHIYNATSPYNNMDICNAIREEGVDNFTFYVIETCNEDVVSEREKYWIEKLDSYHNGYNSTLGGSGVLRDLYNLSNSNIKPISCYTLEGEHIRDYDSRGIASKELGVMKSSITACIKGTTFQAGGYRWSWKNENLVDKKSRVNRRGKIYGLHKNGERGEWPTQADCAEFMTGQRTSNGNIHLSINSPDDNKYSCKGWYLWRNEVPSNWTPSKCGFNSETAKKAARLQGTKCGRKGRKPSFLLP